MLWQLQQNLTHLCATFQSHKLKHEATRILERPRQRQYNIKTHLKEIRWEGMDWIQVVQH